MGNAVTTRPYRICTIRDRFRTRPIIARRYVFHRPYVVDCYDARTRCIRQIRSPISVDGHRGKPRPCKTIETFVARWLSRLGFTVQSHDYLPGESQSVYFTREYSDPICRAITRLYRPLGLFEYWINVRLSNSLYRPRNLTRRPRVQSFESFIGSRLVPYVQFINFYSVYPRVIYLFKLP